MGNNEKLNLANVYNDKGLAYMQEKNFPESLKYYQKALSIIESIWGEKHIFSAIIHNNIADVCWMQKNFEKAAKEYKIALDISKNESNKNYGGIAQLSCNLGGVYMELGYDALAQKYLISALKIAASLREEELLYAILYNLKRLHEKICPSVPMETWIEDLLDG